MRITNTMMINNSLANIAVNKNQLSTLDTQMSTKKKINRPSEDPIIAIRALRLRSSLNEVTQYLEKNIPDANSWMKVIQGALEEGENVVSDLYKNCNQGATDSYSTEQRATLADDLQNLKETYYDQGNVDYAGRYVFSGYRTDSRLTFASEAEADNYSYSITQGLTADNFDTKYVYSNPVDVTDLESYINSTAAIPDVDRAEVYRMRLAYSDTDSNTIPVLQYQKTDASGKLVTDADGNPVMVNVADKYPIKSTTDENAIPGDDEILYNANTGELIFGKNAYLETRNQKNLNVTYSKTNFDKGDVKPEHYFMCVRTDRDAKALADKNGTAYTPITYNEELAADNYGMLDKQLEYMVNFSQKIRVNSSASQCFNIYLGRDVDDLSSTVSTVSDIETAQAKLKQMKESPMYANDEAAQKRIEELSEVLDNQFDLAKDSMQEVFDAGVTKMQNYDQENRKQQADIGNRLSRLELNESRLTEQQTNFKELKSKNEDVELEDAMINYYSAELVYNSSISAASKVVRQSLLDFL